MKRLNVGCGRDYRQGWINIDYDKKIKADKYFDLRDKFPFKDNCFDYILAQDVLEHFTKEDAKSFLAECGRILKVGGKIKVRTHNITQIIKQFKNDPEVLIKFIYGNTSSNCELGSHKYAYTSKTLSKTLERAGFEVLGIKKETTNIICLAEKAKKTKQATKIIVSMQDSGGIGGAENFLISLSKALIRKNVGVEFTTWEKSHVSKNLRNMGYRLYTTPVRMDVIGGIRGLIKFFLYLPLIVFSDYMILKDFKKRGGSMVVLSGISDKIVLSPISKVMGLGVLWIEFAPLASVFKRNFYIPKILYRLVKDLPDKVIIPTFYAKTNLIPETRISETKMHIIPCGIELDNIKIPKKVESRTKIIGMISRIEKGKGQDLLIKAISKFKKRNFKAVIIGKGDLRGLKSLAKNLGVLSKIKFLGYLDKIESELNNFDVFVFPSTWSLEGFGLVLVEAMNAGVPIVTTDFGPIPEVVENAAHFVKSTPEDIANGIVKVLSDEKYAKRLIKKGFSQVKKYDINTVADKYYGLLTDYT